MKTILLENGGLLTSATKAWVEELDPNFKEINPDCTRLYMRRNDLHFFSMLVNPELETIATSSTFELGMPFEALVSFDKKGEDFLQIEYFAWLFYEAVGYRKQRNLPKLNIHINYRGGDFLENLKKGRLGVDTKSYLKLMLRQSEGFVRIYLYQHYELINVFSTEDDLKLN